jgi:hypothetical protein
MLVAFDPLIQLRGLRGADRRSVTALAQYHGSHSRRHGDPACRFHPSCRIHRASAGPDSVVPGLREYTVLLVSRDTGVPIVLGSAMLILLALVLPCTYRGGGSGARAEVDTSGRTIIKVGGFALQRRDAVEEEFAEIVRRLDRSAAMPQLEPEADAALRG